MRKLNKISSRVRTKGNTFQLKLVPDYLKENSVMKKMTVHLIQYKIEISE